MYILERRKELQVFHVRVFMLLPELYLVFVKLDFFM
jgi:hypothetical protein